MHQLWWRCARVLLCALVACAGGCDTNITEAQRALPRAAPSAPTSRPGASAAPGGRAPALAMTDRLLHNRFAYIPPQCYTKTRDERGRVANPCYVCHADSRAPNYVDDAALQRVLTLPPLAARNPWSNLFAPAVDRAPVIADAELDRYVRESNYLDAEGQVVLAARLAELPAEWDGDGDAAWQGYVPDAYFHFDVRGYDVRPDGVPTGWRAFAYAPLPGTFFPTNGSAGDVLIRLDSALREDDAAQPDLTVSATNLAIVEALITRRDVPIAATDEASLGADLDLDGQLALATRVRFADGAGRMHYVGRARALERAGTFPIAAGLFPLGTEFLHSLRYLDVRSDADVALAPRMKELRYAKKVRWLSDTDLKAHAAAEAVEQNESVDRAHQVLWQFDRGVYNGEGWLLQGFIEARDGQLRPQTYEESVFCIGCHGGIGVTSDSMFSLARKLSAPQGGWFHWTQHGLRGLPEPKGDDGRPAYGDYLAQNRAGDEFRDNDEVRARFFDNAGNLRPHAMRTLHRDIATLLLPSPARARALNRAYLAVVLEQSFIHGRDAVLRPSEHVYRDAPVDAATGIGRARAEAAR